MANRGYLTISQVSAAVHELVDRCKFQLRDEPGATIGFRWNGGWPWGSIVMYQGGTTKVLYEFHKPSGRLFDPGRKRPRSLDAFL